MQLPGRHRHLRRYRQIADVLVRQGLGYVVAVLDLGRFVSWPRSILGRSRSAATHSPAERVRLALEELGTTFIKIGQILSTRPDLVPPSYQRELARLQDSTPPVPFEAIEQIISAELGRPVAEIFSQFDPVPLASASIGQAHAAVLQDGTEVVVKVQRPGAGAQVGVDLEILENLAQTASRRWEVAEDYDVVALVEEFAETLRGELDYSREVRNGERFAANFARDPHVHIPRIYPRLSSSRVITMERIRGIKINDMAALDAAGIDRAELAERAAQVVLKMAFEDRFFHADPHPGNFFVEPGGRIGLIDFGMVGTLDEATQQHLITLLIAITTQDPNRMIDALLDLGAVRGRFDRTRLRHDLQHLLATYAHRTLGEIQIGPVLNDVLTIVRRNHLQLPANLGLLMKMAVMVEGLGRDLDPEFQVIEVAKPYARRLLLQRFSPKEWGKRLGQASLDMAELSLELPQQVHRLMGDLERGSLQIGARPEGFEHLLDRAERMANRLVLALMVATLVNGLGVLLLFWDPGGIHQWAGYVFVGVLLLTILLVATLAWNVWHGLRR